ncbi:25086_t:CDS:2, partial [Racocetra persica]
EELRLDWMLLAEMGPNAVINDSCDLGTRNMDLTHRWVDDARQCYSDTDLANANTFICQASSCHVEPLKIIILGTAGTGKSYLVNVIRYTLHQITEIGSKSPVLVLAPTGAAAFNINGMTIYSVLSIAINDGNDNLDINGERLKQLQKRLEDHPSVLHYLFDMGGVLEQ